MQTSWNTNVTNRAKRGTNYTNGSRPGGQSFQRRTISPFPLFFPHDWQDERGSAQEPEILYILSDQSVSSNPNPKLRTQNPEPCLSPLNHVALPQSTKSLLIKTATNRNEGPYTTSGANQEWTTNYRNYTYFGMSF